MLESPRAQRAARRHQTASLSKSTPSRELSPPLFELTGSTVSTLTTGNTVQTALNDDEEVDFVGGGGGGFDDEWREEGNGGEEEEEVLLPPLPPLKSIFDCGYVHQSDRGYSPG